MYDRVMMTFWGYVFQTTRLDAGRVIGTAFISDLALTNLPPSIQLRGGGEFEEEEKREGERLFGYMMEALKRTNGGMCNWAEWELNTAGNGSIWIEEAPGWLAYYSWRR